MKLEQSFDVAAPLERVWNALIDVEHVAPCLPGASVTGRNEDGSYNGTFTIKIGPTTASYTGKLEMEEIDEARHRATMQANGTDKRGQGGAKATIVSSLVEAADGQTRVQVATDYQITGRLARFGRGGMIEDISERLLREFASRLQKSLARDPGSGEAGQSAEPAPVAAADPPAAEEEPPPAEEAPAEEDRWQTVNVAALKRDGAQTTDEPAPEPPEPPEAPPPPEPTEEAPAPAEAPPPVADAPLRPQGPSQAPPPPDAPPPPEAEAPPQAPPPPQALSAPPPPVEPFDAGSAVSSVMWDRLRSNAVLPFAFIAGLILALILFRRRARR
jgi:uncharacterized protein